MANDNKPLKYLRYAIGEIVLVVIGILIALQVNIWNENRKSKLSQNKLLVQLLSDLDRDVERFNEINSIYQIDLEEIEFVFEEALSGKNVKLNSTKQMVAGRGSTLYLNVTKSTYEEMLNTGLLYQIENESLKNEINKYYELVDFILEKENRDNQNLNSWLLGIKKEDPKKVIMRLREQRNLEHIDWSWLQNPNSELYKEIETQFVWLKAAIESNQDAMERLKLEANALKNTIRNHLEIK